MNGKEHEIAHTTRHGEGSSGVSRASEMAEDQAAGGPCPDEGAEASRLKDTDNPADLCAYCTLAEARKGDRFVVTDVDDPQARLTALRFGMAEGACIECLTRIPAGPIVLRSGRQEIAVGRDLAKRIHVRHQADTHSHRARRHGRGRDDKGRTSTGS